MDIVLAVTRTIHVFGAVIWAGVAFVNYLWLSPAVHDAGPAGGAVMQRILSSSFQRTMMIVPLLTVISGLLMYWFFSGHFSVAYLTSWKGLALTLGALAGIVAFLEGLFVTGRVFGSDGQAGQGDPGRGRPADGGAGPADAGLAGQAGQGIDARRAVPGHCAAGHVPGRIARRGVRSSHEKSLRPIAPCVILNTITEYGGFRSWNDAQPA